MNQGCICGFDNYGRNDLTVVDWANLYNAERHKSPYVEMFLTYNWIHWKRGELE